MNRGIILLTLLVLFMRKLVYEEEAASKQKIVLSSSNEKIVIDHGLELYKNLQNHESDCFKKVTIKLINGCNSLNFDSIQNMEYALMLTLCELGSANLAVPKECMNLSENPSTRSSDIKRCVKKLSNLPQTWTSYSGYFRDVVLMCFAIRYPMEKEILQKLHTNITLNQVKNFNILQQQQEYLISWRNEEFNALSRLKDSQLEIIDQMERVQGTHSKSAEQIQSIFDALVLLQNQTEAIIIKYNNLIQYHVNEMQTQLNQLVIRQEYELDHVVGTVVSGLQTIDRNIEEMIGIQQEALESWTQAKDVQSEYMANWRDSIDTVNTNLNYVLNQSLNSVKGLQNEIATIHHQIKFITAPIQWTSNALSNLFSGFKRAALNLFMHTALFYHLSSIFEGYGFFKKTGLSSFLSIAHQYVVSYFLPANSTHPYDTFIKTFIVLAEWAIKQYIVKKRQSNGRYSIFQEDHDSPTAANNTPESDRPSSDSNSSDFSILSSSNSNNGSNAATHQKVPNIPKYLMSRFQAQNNVGSTSGNKRRSRYFIRSNASSPHHQQTNSSSSSSSSSNRSVPRNDTERDNEFQRYNFHRYYNRQ